VSSAAGDPPTPETASSDRLGARDEQNLQAPPLFAGNLAFWSALAVIATGFAYTALEPQHWLRGVIVSALGFLLGAVLRAFLPAGRAGLLEMRTKALDVLFLGLVAVLIVTVGLLLPR
jgi:hypothetical protein